MDYDQRKKFGFWIKSIRMGKNIKIPDLVKKLGYYSKGTITSVEGGRTCIPFEYIHPWAEVLGINPQDIVEKIQEFEPERYERFVRLERNFFIDFTNRIMSPTLPGGKFTSYILSDLAKFIEALGQSDKRLHNPTKTMRNEPFNNKLSLYPNPPINNRQQFLFDRRILADDTQTGNERVYLGGN